MLNQANGIMWPPLLLLSFVQCFFLSYDLKRKFLGKGNAHKLWLEMKTRGFHFNVSLSCILDSCLSPPLYFLGPISLPFANPLSQAVCLLISFNLNVYQRVYAASRFCCYYFLTMTNYNLKLCPHSLPSLNCFYYVHVTTMRYLILLWTSYKLDKICCQI